MTHEYNPAPDNIEWSEDPRYRTSQRELAITAIFFAVYIVVMVGVAWLIGGGDSISDITYVLGFPAWFFWSALFFGAVFCVVPYFLVRYLFTDVPLDSESDTEQGPDATQRD
ncbi:MAG: DUF997 family protein [Streptosporangiales bacterium]